MVKIQAYENKKLSLKVDSTHYIALHFLTEVFIICQVSMNHYHDPPPRGLLSSEPPQKCKCAVRFICGNQDVFCSSLDFNENYQI